MLGIFIFLVREKLLFFFSSKGYNKLYVYHRISPEIQVSFINFINGFYSETLHQCGTFYGRSSFPRQTNYIFVITDVVSGEILRMIKLDSPERKTEQYAVLVSILLLINPKHNSNSKKGLIHEAF